MSLDDLDGRIGESWGGAAPNGSHVNVVLGRRGSRTGTAATSMFAHPAPGHMPVRCCLGPSERIRATEDTIAGAVVTTAAVIARAVGSAWDGPTP